jgi:[ribosomal protein S5]-alanine N-acetyltransferase
MSLLQSIDTNRLVLRELVEGDFEDICIFKSDNKVVKYLTWGPSSREQTLKSLRKQIAFQNEENRKIYVLAVVLKNINKVIGNALFMVKDDNFDIAEIGYFINSDFWKNGYGEEIVNGLLDLGFKQFKMHRIYAVCDVENISSVNLLKKIGFRLEGHFFKDLKVRGEWRDNFLFALLKEEFDRKQSI